MSLVVVPLPVSNKVALKKAKNITRFLTISQTLSRPTKNIQVFDLVQVITTVK